MKNHQRRRQSEAWTEEIHAILRWRFEDNDLIFCVEKIEVWRLLLHIKSKDQLYRVWLNNGSKLGRINLLETATAGK